MYICKNCGKETDDNKNYCDNCGTRKEAIENEEIKNENKSENETVNNTVNSDNQNNYSQNEEKKSSESSNKKSSFCFNCGNHLSDDMIFCNVCGTKKFVREEKSSNSQNRNESNTYSNNSNSYYGSSQGYENRGYYSYEKPPVSKRNAIKSLIFGGIGLEFSVFCFIPIFVFIFAIPTFLFMALGFASCNSYLKEGGVPNGFSKAGHALCKATMIVGIVMCVLGVILTLVLFGVI